MKIGQKNTQHSNLQPKANAPFFQRKATEQAGNDRSFFFNKSAAPTIQTKLTIGQPDDKYEREADSVADRVVRGEPAMNPTPAPPVSPVQRKCTDCEQKEKLQKKEGEEEMPQADMDLQLKPIFDSGQEPPEENTLGDNAALGIMRKCSECGKEHLQTKSEGGDTTTSPDLQSTLNASKGGGSPLPGNVRTSMESGIGADFSGVKVHTDSNAVEMNQQLGAQAFTHGSHIYFNEGKYDSGSSGGKHLLAHELTHTVQQGGAIRKKIQRKLNQKDLNRRAKAIFEAVDGRGTTEDKIFENVSGLDKSEAQELIINYNKIYSKKRGGRSLTKDLEYEFEDKSNLYRAFKLLHYRVNTQSLPISNSNVGIKVNPPKKTVPPGTEVDYELDLGESIYNKVEYQWYVYNDPESIFYFKIEGINKPDMVQGPMSRIWKNAKWSFDGEHTVVCMVKFGSEEPIFYKYVQKVEAVPITKSEIYEESVFDTTNEELDSAELGKQVEKIGIVQIDKGTELRAKQDDSSIIGLLPLNTRLFVDRNVGNGWLLVYIEGEQNNKSLPVSEGTSGYVAAHDINTDMPDPNAWLFRITENGQGALSVAKEVFKNNFKPTWGKDYRYLVNVLATVNEAKGRNFLYKVNPNDSWDKAKTKKGQIWIPGLAIVDSLHSQLSSGSISYETLTTLGDIAIGIGAFVTGLLHGAVMSVADVFIGVYDLIKMIGQIIYKLFTGTLISDAKKLWNEIKQIKGRDIIEMVGQKWNNPDVWTRWKFRGYVVGYAIVEILMLIFSVGLVTAIKWAGKAGKFGKLASYLGKFKSVQKVMNTANNLKGKGIDKIRKTLKVANILSEGHGWAAKVLRIPVGILKRLRAFDIDKLKKLPQWARERFSKLGEKAMLRLLGCNSPCKVDIDEIQLALKLSTKGGKVLSSVDNVIKALPKGLNKWKISRKLRLKNSALMTAIREANLSAEDFAKLADFLTPGDANPVQAYRTFTRYLTSVVPAKTGTDIKKLNEILAAIIKAEPRRGAALKGAMFEQWIALHIPELSSKLFGRITFNLKKLLKKVTPPYRRTVDKWVSKKGEIWDMKHQLSKVPTSQADDYLGLLGKIAPDGQKVKSINYLFPTLEAAKLNKHLSSTYRFAVYYVDDVTNTLIKLY